MMATPELRVGNVELVDTVLDQHKRRQPVADPHLRLHLFTAAGAGRVADLSADDAFALALDLLSQVQRRRRLLEQRRAAHERSKQP